MGLPSTMILEFCQIICCSISSHFVGIWIGNITNIHTQKYRTTLYPLSERLNVAYEPLPSVHTRRDWDWRKTCDFALADDLKTSLDFQTFCKSERLLRRSTKLPGSVCPRWSPREVRSRWWRSLWIGIWIWIPKSRCHDTSLLVAFIWINGTKQKQDMLLPDDPQPWWWQERRRWGFCSF